MSSHLLTPGDATVILGESPCWCVASQSLYWVDIDGRRLHRTREVYVPTGESTVTNASSSDECIQLPSTTIPSAIGLIEGHSEWTWIATNIGVFIFDWSSCSSILLPSSFPPTLSSSAYRYNDGKINSEGDLIVSTMITQSDAKLRKGKGGLWKMRIGDGTVTAASQSTSSSSSSTASSIHFTLLLSNLTIPNGLDWNYSNPVKEMFFIDTPMKRVELLEINAVSTSTTSSSNPPSSLLKRTTLFTTHNLLSPSTQQLIRGEPDGMTQCYDGSRWVAMNGGGTICRFSPSGALLTSITIPVSKVTSLCFGGSSLRDLYVTTASKGVDRVKEPLAGAVFIVEQPGGRGKEMHKMKLRGMEMWVMKQFSEKKGGVTKHEVKRRKFDHTDVQQQKSEVKQLRSKL